MTELVDQKIGPIGLGLMGLTWRAGPAPPQEQAFETMRVALKNGGMTPNAFPSTPSFSPATDLTNSFLFPTVNFWNGGDFYGGPDYNSLVLLERYFEKYPEDADNVVISIKGGLNPKTHQIDASPENTRYTLDSCLAQLKGRKKLDIFEFGRNDPKVPLEVTFGVLQKEYIDTGKLGGISLSEVSAETIHEAVKYAKIVAVEVELSL